MIGVIGCGTMAQAIVKGFHKKYPQEKFLTYTPSLTRAQELAREVQGNSTQNLKDFGEVKTIIVACKPQQLSSLAQELKAQQIDLKDKHLISILAATPIKTLQEKLGSSSVTRVMPNTPALIGQGMSLILHSEGLNHDQKDLVEKFFKACGEVVELEEEKIFDQVTTVSGSGPAYVFYFAQTMAQKLEEWGVDSKSAKKIVTQLFTGSSELMKEQQELPFEQLISNVTSKGGVTIEAVKSYRADHLDQLTSKALDAAFKRSEEIKKELGV